MTTNDRTSAKEPDAPSPEPPAEKRIKPQGEVVVEHHPTPPKGPDDKRIHPRRPLPPVPTKTDEDSGS